MKINVHISTQVQSIGDSLLLGTCIWKSNISRTNRPIEAVDNANKPEEIVSILNNVTGFFTIITETIDGIAIATDVVSSIPLFYTVVDGVCHISDSHPPLINQLDTATLDSV